MKRKKRSDYIPFYKSGVYRHHRSIAKVGGSEVAAVGRLRIRVLWSARQHREESYNTGSQAARRAYLRKMKAAEHLKKAMLILGSKYDS